MREITFDSAGKKIRALYYPPPWQGGSPTGGNTWPAVLVSHGALGTKEQFQSLAEYLLRAGFAVLVPDMRGHGESAGDRYHVVIGDWMDDLKASIAWLAAQPEVDVHRIGGFGFSSGGTAMLELACGSGHGLKTLVTLGATVRSILSPMETHVFRILGRLGRIKRHWLGSGLHLPLYPLVRSKPAARDPAINRAIMGDPHVRAGYWRYPIPGALDSFIVDTLERVGNVRIPVCVLHGENDRVDSPNSARALFGRLGGEKTLHLIPNSGHVGHLDQSSERVFALTLQWYQSWLI